MRPWVNMCLTLFSNSKRRGNMMHIPLTLMSYMKYVINSLFELPLEIKHRNVDVNTISRYMVPSATNPLYKSLGLYDITSPQGI
ncbi:hypothetical protein OSB04_027532 [Centaurea solstitialis]|uniref:Uncharacterized protein n=1 Tax=Centaurea solstitialis TaxID=347529 RepID=A0AA38WAC1_9ASTR|nr:hypothetical protein OSB04_027532 [Centaurea solstitialis]